MSRKNPYDVIKRRLVTEKAATLGRLKSATSNPCVSRCEKPKYVFIVDPFANKQDIANAIEEIYKDLKITVKSVNTINVKSRPGRQIRRRRGRGTRSSFKKAVVTLAVGDSLDNE